MPRASPWIEDFVVIRRRVRIEGKENAQRIEIGTSTTDTDVLLAVLARAHAYVLSGKFVPTEGLGVEFKEADN